MMSALRAMLFIGPKFTAGEAHVHRCPECHDDEICGMACSHHLDPDDAAGPPKRGSYAVCNQCEAAKGGG